MGRSPLNWSVWGDDMQLFSVIMPKMIYFFILMVLGFVLAKIRILPRDGLPTLSALVVKVCLPCLQMGLVFERGTTFATFADQKLFALMQLAAYVLLTVLGIAGAKAFQLRFPQRNSFTGGMVGGNFGFLFIPLILSVLPEFQGYIPVMAAMDTLYVWTIGLMLYSEGCTQNREGRSAGTFLKKLINPMLIAILLALMIMTVRIPLPQQVIDAVTNVGSVSGPVGMMLLGANICYMSKNLKGTVVPALGFAVLRQLIAPLLVFLLSRQFLGAEEALLLMLLTGIPTMTTTGLLAIEYHTDVDFASNLVFVSTLSSLVTLPLTAYISAFL